MDRRNTTHSSSNATSSSIRQQGQPAFSYDPPYQWGSGSGSGMGETLGTGYGGTDSPAELEELRQMQAALASMSANHVAMGAALIDYKPQAYHTPGSRPGASSFSHRARTSVDEGGYSTHRQGGRSVDDRNLELWCKLKTTMHEVGGELENLGRGYDRLERQLSEDEKHARESSARDRRSRKGKSRGSA